MEVHAEPFLSSIIEILSTYIHEQYINNESYLESIKIREAIYEFTNEKLDWNDRTIFTDLRTTFPDFNFDNQTHFFYNDRCFQIYVEKQTESLVLAYTIYLSIFGYFTVYSRNYNEQRNSETKYQYDAAIFKEKGVDPFCDKVFQIILKYYPDTVWLPNNILLESIHDLKIYSDRVRKDIQVFDLLFTQNR